MKNDGRILRRPKRVLVIDVGGTHVKILMTGKRVLRKVNSGPTMTAQKMVDAVKRLTIDWSYEAVSIGYPGPVLHGRPVAEPKNLGGGWVGFDFERAFARPVRMINDAAMQALGSYREGRMLFLGLGTGLGSALIIDGVIEPMELAHLPYKNGLSYEEYMGVRGLKRFGKKKWRHHVVKAAETLRHALQVDFVVLGGGNVKNLKNVPAGIHLGNNAHAFIGGYRLWKN